MKTITSILMCFLLFLCSMTSKALNAPVTIAGIVVNLGPDVVVPVIVTNFVDIGAISLTLDYNNSIVQITGISPNVNLPGFTADWTTHPGRLIMGWYGSPGVTLADYSHIVDISFTGLVAGETALTWIDDGGSCEYAKYDGGAYTVLNDGPTGDYYKNGHIGYGPYGPVTVAPVYTSAPDQDICIPIKIYQGANIGAISLTLDYDPSVLTFQSINSSTIPGTWSLDGQAVNPGRLIVGGLGPGISLPDGAVLFNACFHYNGGNSTLAWWDADGTACEYADAVTLNPYYDLPQSTYYIDGLVTGPLKADFIADNLTPPKNTTVHFTDLSMGVPTSWDWGFDRTTVTYKNGTNSHSQNPDVQFTDGGPYTVTLVVHQAYLTNSEIKTDYIRAGISGLWTGVTGVAWSTTTNWDNWLVPFSSTNVVIPPSAPFWPVFSGDLTLGTTCKSITMNGSSEATITGDFVIGPGSTLNFTGNGTLKPGGDWVNYGSFNAGTGTIEFIGTEPASILYGPVINIFYNLTVSKSNAVLTIYSAIIVNGDVVINP